MGWQEEAVEQIRNSENELANKLAAKSKYIKEFWDDVIEENNKLLPELKFTYEVHEYSIFCLFRKTNNFKTHLQGLTYFSRENRIAECSEHHESSGSYVIEYDPDRAMLVLGERLTGGWEKFKIDSNSAAIILKNLCVCEYISEGLERINPVKPHVSDNTAGCFIATAAMGSPIAQEVIILSIFRDVVLSKNTFGKVFVKIYYMLSPYIASYISKDVRLQQITAKYFIKPLSKAVMLFLKSLDRAFIRGSNLTG